MSRTRRRLGQDEPRRRRPHRHPGPSRPAQRPDAGHLGGAARRSGTSLDDDVRVVVVRGAGPVVLRRAGPQPVQRRARRARRARRPRPAARTAEAAGADPRLPGRASGGCARRASSRSRRCRATRSAPAASWRSPATCGCSPTTRSCGCPRRRSGLVPDLTGTSTLVELVGYSRALEICLTGRAVRAAEAHAIGLANLVVPAAELDATVADLVAALTGAAGGRQPGDGGAGALRRPQRPRRPQDAAERAAQVLRLQELARFLTGVADDTASGTARPDIGVGRSTGRRRCGRESSHDLHGRHAVVPARSVGDGPRAAEGHGAPDPRHRPALPPRADVLPAAGGRLVADRRDHAAAGRRHRQPDRRAARHRRRHRADRADHRRAGGRSTPASRWPPAGSPRGSARASSTTCAAGCSSTCSGCRSRSSPARRPARWSAG